jgi:hypothetical protein
MAGGSDSGDESGGDNVLSNFLWGNVDEQGRADIDYLDQA